MALVECYLNPSTTYASSGFTLFGAISSRIIWLKMFYTYAFDIKVSALILFRIFSPISIVYQDHKIQELGNINQTPIGQEVAKFLTFLACK